MAEDEAAVPPAAAAAAAPDDLERGLQTPLAPSRASQELARRQAERELVLQWDSRELQRNDAWFLVETAWLDAWLSYVLSEAADEPRPGPLRNDALFDRQEFCVRQGLEATKHYRGVNPQVYALYAELYGTAGAQPLVRWTLDLYAVPVMVDDVRAMLRVPQLRARAAVAELREAVAPLAAPAQRRREDETRLYRCLCRCEYLVPCLHRLLGGGPTYKKEESASWGSLLCCTRRKKLTREQRQKRRHRRRRRERQSKRSEDATSDASESESDSDSDSDSEQESRGLLG